MTDVISLARSTVVVTGENDRKGREMAARVLVEEVGRRTGLIWEVSAQWPRQGPAIVITSGELESVGGQETPRGSGDSPEAGPEGFYLTVTGSKGEHRVWIISSEPRGVLYGVGCLLRHMKMRPGEAGLDPALEVATAPAYAIRGHQLGYRDKANSYDAWTVEQYDRYIRELALFGANSIENIPFEDKQGPLMKLPRAEMNLRLSEICDKYDLDYWVWTPASFDLSDEKLRREEIERHRRLYESCPRLNGVFFPGGDPGNNHPRLVLPFLRELSKHLEHHHPGAGIWMSLQGFGGEEVDYVFDFISRERPSWLAGVVAGPSSPPIKMLRERLPRDYRLRDYPDITHTVRCQHEVEWWDQAYALTLGREASNPQPRYYAHIHGKDAPGTDGFISYSDGAHDDVNKVVFTRLGFSPEEDLRSILTQYCRFFFGPDLEEEAADGILALEDNWDGRLDEKESVESTLKLWQVLESRAPELAGNWRWQLLLLRAHYDAYTRRRLLREEALEREAMAVLSKAHALGPEAAMEECLRIVRRAEEEPVSQELRKRIVDLCEDLFQSLGLQTSVSRYHASGPERGCVLDFLDHPLNNRWWLEDQFHRIQEMGSEEEKLARLKVIAAWENPGPGSLYDDVGNTRKMPHVERGWYPSPGYAWWDGGMSRTRLSSQIYMGRPTLNYDNVDPEGQYTIRVAGFGEALLEVNGIRVKPTIYNKEEGQFKEFPIPKELLAKGEITVTFARPDEAHLNWRHRSRVSDVWLLKR